MRAKTVNSAQLPAVGAPLSHAVVAQGLVFCSGQVPLGPDGRLVGGGVGAMTRQALTNLGLVLQASGSALDRVVRTTVFLTDMADYAEMNAAYADVLKHRPARTCVQVAALPLGARVEIECLGIVGG